MAKAVLQALVAKFGDKILASEDAYGDETATVKADALKDIASFLRDDPKMAFDAPVFVTCIDNIDSEPRFEVCYQLRSTTLRHRIRIKIPVTESKPEVTSLTELWPGFDWQERETFDMYGIRFDGHPDLRRIYLYDEFEGYPLRKDYPKDKRQPLVRREYNE